MILTAAVLLAGSAWLLLMPSRRRRLARISGSSTRAAGRVRPRMTDPVPLRLLSVAAGSTVAVVVGGLWGLLAGATLAVGFPILVGRLEPASERRRREELQRQASAAADLLGACLASGASLPVSAHAVARALGTPLQEPLDALVRALHLGEDPVRAWRELARVPGLGALGRAAARSQASGAPLAQLLPGIADDLRREDRARAETAARAAGVRAVAPLAACFLPAFLLLGVVPIVVSLALPLLAGGPSG